MDINKIISRYGKLKGERDGYWLSLWRDARKFVMPTYSDFLPEGGIRGQEIFDTTAIAAANRLAAGMYNWMAPPTQRWFELMPADPELQKDEEVTDYFAELTRLIGFEMANSNWSGVLIQALNDLACGLDAIVFVQDGGAESTFHFKSFPVENVCFAENEFGKVDTVYTETDMTVRQIVEAFPDCGEFYEAMVKDPAKIDEKIKVLHVCLPRRERDAKMRDAKNMPFADLYIDYARKAVIHEGGYEEFPFAVCRWWKHNNETHGRGPGINMLPDIKMLNRMRQAYIIAKERCADPSWLIPDGTVVGKNFDTSPGSVNFYKNDLNGAKPEMIPPPSGVNDLARDIEEERSIIKLGFFADIFDPLGDLKQITATEAEIRNEGKMVPFAPIAGNLHSELFEPVIQRAFGIIARRGMLPEPPAKIIANPDYKIEFVSKIARAIRKLESTAWLQTEASLVNLAQVKPDIMDNFDLDEIARAIAVANGANPAWLIPVKDRDKKRAEAAQAQAAQAQAQELIQGAGALGQNLGKKPEEGSPLSAVMNGLTV